MRRTIFALFAITLLLILWTAPAQAQAQRGGWSEPYRLSSEAGRASEATLVTDQYGFVHCFWRETLFEDGRTVIKYARFDGGTWSVPNDIYLTSNGIENLSAAVDQHGTLHIVWTEGFFGPVYYSYAPASNALSARNWSKPLQIDIPAGVVRFRVDSRGVFHIVYIDRTEERLGVYYVRSEDQGVSWSEPIWIDPDILPHHTPDSLHFELDETGGLHAVWFYGALEQNARPDWIRYSHSLDGGETWSAPFMIDRYVEESEHNLTSAGPIMIVQGQTVHVIWAAGSLPYRNYRFSTDAGRTWSERVQVFGELHGQAFDGLTVDRAGRVHFIGQIRYPMGIYHAYWDKNQWNTPSLVYLIAQGEYEEGVSDRVHAHHTLPAIRAGNQLVITFTDGPADPNRRLFVTYRTLNDISPLENVPTPTPTATPVLTPTPVPSSTQTPNRPTPMPSQPAASSSQETAEVLPVGPVPGPDHAIRMALIPALIILAGTMMIRFLFRRKR
jgi:hypothetical protein